MRIRLIACHSDGNARPVGRVGVLALVYVACGLAPRWALAIEPPSVLQQQPDTPKTPLPGAEPNRSSSEAAATERVRGEADGSQSSTAGPQSGPGMQKNCMPTITQGPDSVGACLVPEYHPLYSADHDYELQSTPGTRGHEDLSALDLFTVGANMTFGEVGKRWQVGLLGAEVSYVPWASRSLWWVGFVADYSHDRTVERDRLGAGLEGGYGPFGLDFAPLLKVGTVKREESRVGLQARAVISLPTWYTRPDYDRACCPSDSTLRSCACAKSIWTFPLLEPYVSVEIWHNGPEQTVRAFAGVVGKFGYGF